MQALFGFQLVAVFTTAFKQLPSFERELHLAAIVLLTLAIALVMAPAALHRQTEPFAVSRRFITLSSRLLMASMAPLAVGIGLDVYVVTRATVGDPWIAAMVAAVSLSAFVVLWLLFPRSVRRSPQT
jgi:hypothetical protein